MVGGLPEGAGGAGWRRGKGREIRTIVRMSSTTYNLKNRKTSSHFSQNTYTHTHTEFGKVEIDG